MDVPTSIIETGVDKLVKLVKESGRVAVPDAAKMLNVSTTIIMEWADFLEEEGIISIEYKFTKPFLVERKLTKKEVEAKSKEFETKKDIFVRKAEITLGSLGRQADEFKKVQGEFDSLKKKYGFELDTVKNDLKQLDDYEKQREETINRIFSQKQEAEGRIKSLTRKICMEERKLKSALAHIRKEHGIVVREKLQAKSIEKYEKILAEKLDSVKRLMNSLDRKLKEEDSMIHSSEFKIDSLKKMLQQTRESIKKEKSMIEPLLNESRQHEKKIFDMHKSIVRKIRESRKKSPNAKIVADKINGLFKKKLAAVSLIQKVNDDRNGLQKELIELIKKAKSFQLTSNSAMTAKQMVELENKFKDVDKKKGDFEKEYRKLRSSLHN